MQALKTWLGQYPVLKRLLHLLVVRPGRARPQPWTRWLLNPWVHRIQGHICGSARRDLFPFQPFSLGVGAVVEDFCTLNNGVGALHIGAGSRVGIGNVLIGPVEIAEHCILAQYVVISGLNHNYQDVEHPICLQGVSTKTVRLEEGCWIGANSTIVAGVRIGRNSVVAAGSVVTKDVPDYCVVGGNPARLLRRYNHNSGLWEKADLPQHL